MRENLTRLGKGALRMLLGCLALGVLGSILYGVGSLLALVLGHHDRLQVEVGIFFGILVVAAISVLMWFIYKLGDEDLDTDDFFDLD